MSWTGIVLALRMSTITVIVPIKLAFRRPGLIRATRFCPATFRRRAAALAAGVSVVAGLSAGLSAQSAGLPPAAVTSNGGTPVSAGASAALSAFKSLPLIFEANQGQTDARVAFLSRHGSRTLFLTAGGEAVLSAAPGSGPSDSSVSSLRLTWLGANEHARPEGVDELPGKSHYLVGDSSAWHTNVPTYSRVRYPDLYPGIDLVYYGNGGRLEYDFVVSPNARPEIIRLALAGADSVDVDPDGDLIIGAGDDRVRLHRPVVYQSARGRGVAGESEREPVDGRYVVGPGRVVRFTLGPYDRSRPLVIDPQLSYSSYLGGGGNDLGWKVAVDPGGIAYIAGWSASVNFPTSSPLQATNNGSNNAVVVKLNPRLAGASSLVYSTYLGGTGSTVARGIAVNAATEIFIAGDTTSPNLATTPGAYRTSCNMSGAQCSSDVFAAKLNASGTALLYATYLGGTGSEFCFALAIDAADHMFLAGPTGSSDFPTTTGAFQTAFAGGDVKFGDAFVAELNPAGGGSSDLLYSTYLGGSGSETPWAIAVDQSSAIYVAGSTASSNFPTTAGAFSRTLSGSGSLSLGDAFVAKLNPAGAGQADLVYSTYLGGNKDERAEGIAVDSAGTVYVTGFTTSSGFPVTAAIAYQPTFGGGTCSGGSPCGDVFVVHLDPSSSGPGSLWYSTFFGGSSFDLGHAIALGSDGFVYVAGETASTNFPLLNPIQAVCFGGCTPPPIDDLFVAKFDLTQSGPAGLLFSTYLGGGDVDTAWGLAVDSVGNAYVTGQTFSTNLPTTIPFQAFCAGCSPFSGPTPSGDMFLVKICTVACPAVGMAPASLGFGAQSVSTASAPQNVTVSNPGTGDLTIAAIGIVGPNASDFAQTNNCPMVLAPLATCNVAVTFTPTATGARSAAVTVTDNGSGSPHSVALSGTGLGPPPPPWPNGYSYQATFTVPAGKVPSAQASFPALISGTFADFKTVANGGRVANTCTQTVGANVLTVPSDLVFTADAAGTTPLSWEFESYNPTTGAVALWVNVPSLATGTVIYAWYGNTAVTSLQTTPSAVWDSRFLAVYHLKEDPSGPAPQFNDSTGNANHCSAAAAMPAGQQVAGKIGGSVSFNGGAYYLTCANPANFAFERTDAWTLSAWSKPIANVSGTVFAKEQDPATGRLQGWELFWRGGSAMPSLTFELANTATARFATRTTAEFATGSFHHVVATYAGTSLASGVTLFVDGAAQAKTSITDALGANSILTATPPQIAARGGPFLLSPATDDEVRVYAKGVVLPAAWVTAEFNNQNAPASFFTVATGLVNGP